MKEIVFWRLDKVLAETSLKRTHLYEMASRENFQSRLSLGKGPVHCLHLRFRTGRNLSFISTRTGCNTIGQ